jgi:hypothetical protein
MTDDGLQFPSHNLTQDETNLLQIPEACKPKTIGVFYKERYLDTYEDRQPSYKESN